MEIGKVKGLQINFLSILFIGGTSIILLVMSIYLLLSNIYGRLEVREIITAVRNMDIVPKDGEYPVAILYSEYSDNLLGGDQHWYENNIRTWQKFAESSGLNLDIITDENLEKGEILDYQLLILPTSKALSDKEIVHIKNYLEDGGNIFATNSTGTFDEIGNWRGWKFFNEVFGTKFEFEFPADGRRKKQSFRGGLPLTAGIPSGFSLRIATWDSPMACSVLEPRTEQIGFWNDFRSNHDSASNISETYASVVSGNYGQGRFVWMGFDINSVYGEQEEYIMFERFFINIMNWLTKKPIIFVKDWPSEYKATAIINIVSKGDISSSQNLINYIEKYSLPVTFLLDSKEAAKDVIKLKTLSQYGDIGALVSLGNLTSAGSISYQLDNFNGQYNRLREAKDNLEANINKKINIAMPLMGQYDENTIHSLIESGYDIIISDSLLNKSVPNSQIKGEKQIIGINKTALSDVEIDQRFGSENYDFKLSTFKDDLDRVILEGGIYNLTLNGHLWSEHNNNDILDELFAYLKDQNVWLTSAEKVRKWWIARNSIEVGIKIISERRVSFLITNPSDIVISNLTVRIDLNKDIKNLVITSEIIGTEIPEYTYEGDKIFIKLKNLKSDQSNSYFIDFDNVLL